MKKCGLLILLLLMFTLVLAQKQYTINGTIPDKYNEGYIYLAKTDIYSPIDTSTTYTDSAYIDKGKFVFKGELLADTLLYSIVLDQTSRGLIAIDTEQLHVTYVEGDPFGHFRVDGSALNDSLTKFTEYPKELSNKLVNQMKSRTELLAKNKWTLEDEAEFEANQKHSALNYMDFISNLVRDNISNPVGQYLLVILGGSIKKEVMDEIEPRLSENIRRKIKVSRESLTKMMKTAQVSQPVEDIVKAGDQYVDFEGEMLSGEKATLSSIVKSKKLVLLDFWASWCVPCLKEMPEIANLYDKYKDKGFEIIGISIDKNRNKWKGMVESTGINWVQFIDSDMSNSVGDIYGVKAIPYTVLIDGHGTIVATDLRGEELRGKIEELLPE